MIRVHHHFDEIGAGELQQVLFDPVGEFRGEINVAQSGAVDLVFIGTADIIKALLFRDAVTDDQVEQFVSFSKA